MASFICTQCAVEFEKPKKQKIWKRTFCSQKCRTDHNRGENHGSWKGGSYVVGRGYTMKHTGPNTRRAEHLLIAEKALGRPLKKGEVVHHMNCDKSDNRNKNLLICTRQYHTALHHKMSELYAKLIFPGAAYV